MAGEVDMPLVKLFPRRVSTEHYRWEKPSQWSVTAGPGPELSAAGSELPLLEFTGRKWQLAESNAF